LSILVAGIGNVFLGDDGFGVEVVKRLAERPRPGWLRVVDFGIRGFDLAYALLDGGCEAAVLVDTLRRGRSPGTLTVLEPCLDDDELASEGTFETHSMEPGSVLRFVKAMGGRAPPLRVVGCEPLQFGGGGGDDDDEMFVGLSEPVLRAIEPAVALTLEVAARLEAESRHA
jgi:hydrogenase maturation protease